jgi:flagellar biosynthesis/type III secretory pathway chaperone
MRGASPTGSSISSANLPSADELAALLAQTETVARQLQSSLSEIKTALASASSSDLLRVLDKETAILARLEDCAPALDPAAGPAADGAKSSGIANAIRDVEPQGGPLHRQWESLRATLQQCNALNRANGFAVGIIEQRVRLAISLLRHGSAAPVAYSPAGATVRSDVRRRVTHA